MVHRQRMILVTGIALIVLTMVVRPFRVAGGLLGDGLTYVPLGKSLPDSDATYLPKLQAAMILFCMFVTAILTILSGDQARRRQTEVSVLAVPALALLCIPWFPGSLMSFFGGYCWPESFIGSADVILALVLTFMLYLRNDPD